MKERMDKSNIEELGLIFILVLLSTIFGILNPNFFSLFNIQNIFKQVSVNGLFAYGMGFVILLGLIDLSIGSIMSFSAYVIGILVVQANAPVAFAIIVGILLGTFLGFINGLLVTKARLQPFIATLGTMTVLRGLTKVISKGLPIRELSENSAFFYFLNNGEILIFPVAMLILLLFLIVNSVVLNKTIYGKHVYATGGNEEAARLSTVNTRWIQISGFMISGGFSALAAVLWLARYNSIYPTSGLGAEMDAIAACVIGGIAMNGGRGKMSGTFIGILIIGVLNNGLDLLGVQSYYQEVIKGMVILLAVSVDNYRQQGLFKNFLKKGS